MTHTIDGSELAVDEHGWGRALIHDYDEGAGFGAHDRVGRALGVRYYTLTHYLDVHFFVAVKRLADGSMRYGVARMMELFALTDHGEQPIGFPASFWADLEFTYPGKIDCDSAILPCEKMREMALADFRTDAWFTKVISLIQPHAVAAAD